MNTVPLSLYIHIPWCVRKCPYCDFNSHRAGSEIPEKKYIDRLIEDLAADKSLAQSRTVNSIFIGGGTPSLFSAAGMQVLLQRVSDHVELAKDVEVTMEANPGTAEQHKFDGFREAGVNRLSVGVQSFQDEKLQALGRIHAADEAKNAINIAKKAGFDRINIDLMHGLPKQTEADALYDINTAIDLAPQHISYYQLTLEPNTVFAKHPPVLPQEETLGSIQTAVEKRLAENSYEHYEISAYAKPNEQCQHNLNYWQFGDYLAIGAGAHGKITQADGAIMRYWKTRNPRDYLQAKNMTAGQKIIAVDELPLEFMMNVLRLMDGVPADLFLSRTGLPLSVIEKPLHEARTQGLLFADEKIIKPTKKGQQFLNNCLALF
jgi:putative oxygen-independent coproporphyrinogen III oxidase